MSSLHDNSSNTTACRRVAHVHLMRTGGTWLNDVVASNWPYPHGFHNSWAEMLGRDWNRDEMMEFLNQPGDVYIHNHLVSWTSELRAAYQRAGFSLFALVRPIGEQLCSLYAFLSQRGADLRTLPVDEFVRGQLLCANHFGVNHQHWAIPAYWQELDFVAPFCRSAIDALFEKQLRIPDLECELWDIPLNSSASPGYEELCDIGVITDETQQILSESVWHRRYMDVLAQFDAQ